MSAWICSVCAAELGELNGYCLYCKINTNTIVYNPDKFFIREIRIFQIIRGYVLTPQEELFSKLFNHEKIFVKDMDTLALRAHREGLAKIAFEARARLTAVDDEENERKKSTLPRGPKGFERSVNTDETTTDAINTIKERQKRLTKSEKTQANLQKLLGLSLADSAQLMQAGTILARLKNPEKTTNGSVAIEEKKEIKIFNPFEKKA